MPLLNTIIVLWSGAIVDIPAGWALCDGNNDLPDLRNKFIVGEGDIYDQDDAGGASPHNHTFTASQHIHSFVAGTDLDGDDPFGVKHFLTGPAEPTGTTDNSPNLPPYYALAYIGKT